MEDAKSKLKHYESILKNKKKALLKEKKVNNDDITEEDTLEVLCVRNNNGLDNAINDIFMEEIKDEKGKIIRTKNKRETINYIEMRLINYMMILINI